MGINHTENLIEEKRVYLINTICWSLICSYALIILIGRFFDEELLHPICFLVYSIQLILIGVIFCFQYIGKILWSKILLITSTSFTCYVFDNFILADHLIEFYYVIPALISLCLFEKKWISFLVLIVQILLFFDVFNTTSTINYNTIHFIVWFTVLFSLFYMLIEINMKAELKLAKKQLELEKMDAHKSRFFINLSHDIKTPLTLINGHISRINFDKSKAENQENLHIVTSQTDAINSIINDILALSRIESKSLVLQKTPTPLIPFLYTHYENFKGLFDKKRITFKLDIDSLDIAILCDNKLFSKSINNLLNNALKFTPKGGNVVIATTTLNSKIEISIKDNGIGIPQNDVDKIFNSFYQSENHITKNKGTGIGLSFVKSIIKAHGFSIQVKSSPNKETKFTITIPEKDIRFLPKETIEPPILNKKKPLKSIGSKERKHILLVDDHTQMRHYLNKVLSNFNITEAKHGKEALNILKRQNFDIIISDYMMPVMDGEAFVKALKQQGIKTPVLILTARSDNKSKLNMLRLGVDAYLNKPFLEEELLLHIDKSLTTATVIKTFNTHLNVDEKQDINTIENNFNQQLNEFVFANIHLPTFGIDAIAAHFNFSRSTLNRKVKALLGQTAKEIIMEARLQKARELLLKNPKETKKHIAQSVGVVNSNYFFRKMKARFGNISN